MTVLVERPTYADIATRLWTRACRFDALLPGRGVAVLMAAWRKASPSARQRFLQILGATTAQPAETKA